jgi:NADH-quinone oxidoreductase subunit J
MLVGRDYSDSIVETLRGQRVAAILLGIGFAGLVGGLIADATSGVESVGLAESNADGGNVAAIARLLFTDYLLAFELTSALLITAAVGAMILAHIEHESGSRPGQKEQSIARIKGPRPQTLTGPGVFARGNSVAAPALLPDGSVAEDSRATGMKMRQPPAIASGSIDDLDDVTVDSGANRDGVTQ